MPFPRSLERFRSQRAPEEERERARQLRAEQTEAEAALWELLRNRKLIGGKFRRQVPIGRYVADFYCHERRLIVELDGEIHSDPAQKAHDESRDAFLRSLGLRILRFSNDDLFRAPEHVVGKIQSALISR